MNAGEDEATAKSARTFPTRPLVTFLGERLTCFLVFCLLTVAVAIQAMSLLISQSDMDKNFTVFHV